MNYVLFFPDEMKAASVSCYGNKHVKMPNFDKLAANGVRFENCIVQNPVCTPSRACLMSGLYVHNFGHRTLWHLMRKEEPSLFRYLKKAGYDVAWYGKNDLYSQDYLNEILNDIEEKRTNYKILPQLPTGHVCKGQNPYELDDKRYYSFLYDSISSNSGKLIWDENVARGIDFLNSRKNNDNPFFLYLPLTMPHPPYNALKEFHDMYNPKITKADLIDIAKTKGKPAFMQLIRQYRKLDKIDDATLEKIYAVYLGMNTYVDTMLGGIMDTLEKTGLIDNTTVIVCSDHGDWAGNYGLVEKWPNGMDDDLVKVPLIIRTPTCKKGHVVNEIVEMFDIMPTVAQLADVEITHTHFAKSLVPQLSGLPGDATRAAFCEGGYDEHEPHCSEAYEGELHKDRNKEMRLPKNIYYPKVLQQKQHPKSVCRTVMMRTLTHKLTLRTSGENELYNLEDDPLELENQYANKKFDAIRLELEKKLLMWYLKSSDTVPITDDPRGFI